jgi:hypothetical protein
MIKSFNGDRYGAPSGLERTSISLNSIAEIIALEYKLFLIDSFAAKRPAK